MQEYIIHKDNWYQYDKLFHKLAFNKMHTTGGLFEFVWDKPYEWITGETIIVTDNETCVSFLSENQYFQRSHLKSRNIHGLFGVYVKPSERGKGKASEMAKRTAKIIEEKTVAILNNEAKHLTKHFQNAIVVR